MKLRAVLFDFDGTLVEFRFKYTECRAAIIELLRGLGFDVSKFSVHDYTQYILDGIQEQMKGRFEGPSFAQVKRKVLRVIDKFEVEAFKASKLTLDVEHIIRFLSEKGYKMGVVTNSGWRAIKLTLERHGLDGIFDTIVTREDAKKMKPYGDGIKLALERLHISAKEAIYVGDSIHDIIAAREAGVTSVAVVGGIHSAERLLQAGPDFIIASLKGIVELVPCLSSN